MMIERECMLYNSLFPRVGWEVHPGVDELYIKNCARLVKTTKQKIIITINPF